MKTCRFCLVFLVLAVTHATILVDETGHRYASHQDHDMGKELYRGYGYPARLQFIDGNLGLCPDSEDFNYTITVPEDGKPVALLVRQGGCSLQEKVNVALEIKPKGYVHFLILDGLASSEDLAETNVVIAGTVTRDGNNQSSNYDDDLMQRFKRIDKANVYDDPHDIPLHILHVSYRTEYDLLDLLLHQSDESRQAGGPALTIDSRTSVSIFGDSSIALWIALSMLTSACCCSFVLLMNGSAEWHPPDEPTPLVRPQRRRLTRTQVKKMLPIYVYDGHGLQNISNRLVDADETSPETEGLVVAHSNNNERPEPHEWELCSICLDDFEAGDKLRILPCDHAFHYRCIGKWLAERSATCPLCKYELWPEEEEDEEGESDGTQVERSPEMPVDVSELSWWDFMRRFSEQGVQMNSPTVRSEVAEPAFAPAVANEPSQRPSWFHRILRRRSAENAAIDRSNTDMLSEPLLDVNQDASLVQEEGMLATSNENGDGASDPLAVMRLEV